LYLCAVEMVITLIIVGAVLLLLETILPGMIAGLLGISCLIWGVGLSYTRLGTEKGNLVLLGVAVGLVAGMLIWVRFFPGSRMAKVFISEKAVGEIGTDRPELLHQKGRALTALRPSGTAVINGQRVDVVTEGSLIERDAPVEVVAIEGLRVVVREL